MKKIFLFIPALFIFLTYGNSQNTSPYWSLAGNSNVVPGSKLGTTNNVSLRFYTNNVQRMIINSAAGFVGIGNSSPVNVLTVQSGGSIPAASWLNGLNSPVFVGFGETVSSEFLLAGASNTVSNRAVFQGRRSRGTLAAPTAVVANDYITSLLASAYDGSNFQNPALISFYVDGRPSPGNVPTRISFVTGSNIDNRTERLKVGSTGDFNFNNGQAFLQQSTGFFGIGTTSPAALLHAEGSGTAVYGNSTNGDYGIYGASSYLGVYGTGGSYGVYGSGGNGYGVYGSGNYGVYGSGTAYGVYGSSYSFTSSGVYGQGTSAFGVSGNSTNNYGGYFTSTNLHGIYAKTSNTNPAAYAAVFQGNTYAYGSYLTSDERIKKNITDFKSGMALINQLKPKIYEFSSDGKYANLNLPKGNHFGLLAQDVEKLFPGLVKEAPLEVQKRPENVISQKTGSNTPDTSALQKEPPQKIETMLVKAINYTELIPIMIKGMQEQDATIKEQQTANENLQSQIDELKSLVQKLSKQVGNTTSLSTAFLRQNSPNPFNANTVISYYIPANVSNAQIKITDVKGSLMKAFSAAKGEGQINIRAGELPAGTYNYTLYINNKTLDTKQMVLLK